MAFVLPAFEMSAHVTRSLSTMIPIDRRDFFRKFMDSVFLPLRANLSSSCVFDGLWHM